MDKPKRNNGTISFSDKSQKEEVQAILQQPNILERMPESIRNKDGLKVLWACRCLKDLADAGLLDKSRFANRENAIAFDEAEDAIAFDEDIEVSEDDADAALMSIVMNS